MKKTFVFFAVAAAMLFAGNTQAQRLAINLGYAPQTTTSSTTILGKTTTSTDDMAGFFAGFDYNIPLTNYFGLAFGAQARYNYKSSSTTLLSVTTTTKRTQILVDVPVLLNFGIRLGNDARLTVFAGPVVSYALKGNTNVSENALNTSTDYNWYGEKSDNQQLDLLGAVGVSFDYQVFRLFGGYRMGFLDLDKSDAVKATTSGLFFGLGYIL